MTPDRDRPACPDEETLAGFCDGSLPASDREALEAHLAECAACRDEVLAVSRAVAEGASPLETPAGVSDRIRASVPVPAPSSAAGTASRRPSEVPVRKFPWVPALAAAVVVGIGLGVFVANRRGRVESDDRPGGNAVPGSEHADAGASTSPIAFARAAEAGEVVPPTRPPDLGGTQRALAHVSTDKPVYRPGERVFARAVLLDAFRRTPQAGTTAVEFTVKSGRGAVVARVPSTVEGGVAAFGWDVPRGQPGGAYTLTVASPWAGMPPGEATFDVRDYRVPRIKTDLQFLRKAYGPGDEVAATLEAVRAEGGAPAGAAVTAVARVDGKEVWKKDGLVLDAQGRLAVSFPLPKDLLVGEGTLALVVRDGGVQETAAKSIPIVVNRVAMTFAPEGGDLVAGVPCRVYFEARTPKQDPADVEGRIEDDGGALVARFASVHEGRGRVAFTPRFGRSYRAVLEKPAGIVDPIALPPTLETGFSLSARADGFAAEEPVRVSVASPTAGAVTVVLAQREKELVVRPVRVPAGVPVEVSLAAGDAAGVLRVTVHDAAGRARAERLVFRRPARSVKVEVVAEADGTVPAGHVTLHVRTTDDLGRPVSATVGVAATDDAVLSTVDPRERAPRLPVQALLGSEVKELRDARLYLGGDAESARRTDLLLSTQGWRRFAFVDPDAFEKANGDAGTRALARARPMPDVARLQAEARRPAGGVVAMGPPPPVPAPPPAAAPVPMPALLAEGKPGAPAEPQADPAPGMADGFEQDADGAFAREAELEDRAEAKLDELVVDEREGDRKVGEEFEGRRNKDLERNARRLRQQQAPVWARVYAHRVAAGRPEGTRSDFTETVYWNAALATDADGRATIAFDASDAVTTVRVRADAFAADGALGEGEATVEVRRPFYAEPKCPLEVTAGDAVQLPVALVNGTTKSFSATVRVEATGGLSSAAGAAPETVVEVPARGSARVVVPLAAGTRTGPAGVRVVAAAGPWKDVVVREVRVVAAGFPAAAQFGGVLERAVEHEVTLPADVTEGSLRVEAGVYPSPLASLTSAVAALLQEPGGCFEQTSSSNYPNVMALQYMKSHRGVDPALVRRASELLERGYGRLVSFETKDRGYEWFGAAPGHEALTAYGVLEFTDMKPFVKVDEGMLARTRAWLLARRDGKGGFQRNDRALDTFGRAPQDVTDAYVVWALLESGETGLDAEVARVRAAATASKDPYLAALAANALAKAGDAAGAGALRDRLGRAQSKDGAVTGAATSITGSGGESLDVETTSLAILAWLPSAAHVKETERAMGWLAARCKGGRFGSTQATILALKAIVAYDARHARPDVAGTVVLRVDDAEVGRVAFPAGVEQPIVLPDFASRLVAGRTHRLRMTMEGGADLPYALSVRWNARTPASSSATKVGVETSLPKATVAEGDPLEVVVKVVNRTDAGVPMALAIVGLPGGLEARADALKELVREGAVDAFETRGREIALYWRGLAPKAEKTLRLSCVAAVPGTYEGPASRAYLYYTDEHKAWVAGLPLVITPR